MPVTQSTAAYNPQQYHPGGVSIVCQMAICTLTCCDVGRRSGQDIDSLISYEARTTWQEMESFLVGHHRYAFKTYNEGSERLTDLSVPHLLHARMFRDINIPMLASPSSLDILHPSHIPLLLQQHILRHRPIQQLNELRNRLPPRSTTHTSNHQPPSKPPYQDNLSPHPLARLLRLRSRNSESRKTSQFFRRARSPLA